MRRALLAVVVAVFAPAIAQARGGGGHSGGSHAVSGHVTSRGTYVAPHYSTNPNSSKADNWSTKGNVNPFTGKAGTKSPD
jgi:hypothetical protein